jgi:hypothetical protein
MSSFLPGESEDVVEFFEVPGELDLGELGVGGFGLRCDERAARSELGMEDSHLRLDHRADGVAEGFWIVLDPWRLGATLPEGGEQGHG